jgi:hypothetical protein
MKTINKLLHLDKRSLARLKIMDIPTSFIWIVILSDEAFKYDDGEEFWGYVGTDSELLCKIL